SGAPSSRPHPLHVGLQQVAARGLVAAAGRRPAQALRSRRPAAARPQGARRAAGGSGADSPASTPEVPMNHQNAILLMEDDALRRPIARRLRRAGYEVLDACSGPDALATLEAVPRPVDLLVTDLIMPRMSGRDLAQRLRERFPALRVLLV